MKQMTLIEMDGFLKGKCIPSDLKVNETNAEYLVRKFGELESKLETALRECRSAGITIDNLEVKCAAMAAENAALKESEHEFDKMCAEEFGPDWVSEFTETPATDAFLDEVRAQGVEMYADNLDSSADEAERCGFDYAIKFLRSEASGVRLFAAQLRSEINYQALREKAEKATWGNWDSYKPHRGARGYEVRLSSQAIAQHVLKNNAEFIAAFNPKIALALLDERERNQQYIKRRDQENEDIALTVGKLRVNLEASEKRIAELESLAAPKLTQQAPVVPDEMTPKQASRSYCGEVRGYRDGWNDCRAAMLQAGKSTVIPDGWVLAPKEITCAMDDAAWEAYHETRCMSDIWAALIAAAPKQEVNRG